MYLCVGNFDEFSCVNPCDHFITSYNNNIFRLHPETIDVRDPSSFQKSLKVAVVNTVWDTKKGLAQEKIGLET